jgi:hypothetical protein
MRTASCRCLFQLLIYFLRVIFFPSCESILFASFAWSATCMMYAVVHAQEYALTLLKAYEMCGIKVSR